MLLSFIIEKQCVVSKCYFRTDRPVASSNRTAEQGQCHSYWNPIVTANPEGLIVIRYDPMFFSVFAAK